jgi:hypothetical protein
MLGKHRDLFVVEQVGKQARHKRRLKVFLPVTIEFHGDQTRAHILDLSKIGARMHAHSAPHPHDGVTIRYGTLAIHGTVAWVKGNGFGIMFDGNLSEPEIAMLLSGN